MKLQACWNIFVLSIYVLAHSRVALKRSPNKRRGWVCGIGMPAPEEEEVPTSSSSYEEVALDEPEAEAPVPPVAAAKADPKTSTVDLSSPTSSEAESSAEEGTPDSDVEEEKETKVDKRPEKVTPGDRGSRGRAVTRVADKRRERERPDNRSRKGGQEKGRGKSKSQGRRACPICWQMVVDTVAGMEQHQYWSVPCNAWRRHNKGTPWEKAVESAEKQKTRRTARFNASGGAASGSKPDVPKKEEKKKKQGGTCKSRQLQEGEKREEGEEESVWVTGPTAGEEKGEASPVVRVGRGQERLEWPW